MSLWALVNKGQIKVGPRDWNVKMFIRYLDSIKADYSKLVNQQKEPESYIDLGNDIKILPVIANVPSYDAVHEQLSGPTKTIENNTVVCKYTVIARTLAMVQTEYYTQANVARDSKILEGLMYTFPDAKKGIIQLRNSNDIQRVIQLGIHGMVLVLTESDTKVTFRDGSNVDHELDGSQLGDMFLAVSNFISGCYSDCWDEKDEIKNQSTVDDIIDLKSK